MIVHVTDIEWDVKDGVSTEELPKKIDLEFDEVSIDCRGPFNEYLYDAICERLEDEYGWCVANFAIDV